MAEEVQAAATALNGMINAGVTIFQVIYQGRIEKYKIRSTSELQAQQLELQLRQFDQELEPQHSKAELSELEANGGKMSRLELEEYSSERTMFSIKTPTDETMMEIEQSMVGENIHFAVAEDFNSLDGETQYFIANKDMDKFRNLAATDPNFIGKYRYITPEQYSEMAISEEKDAYIKQCTNKIEEKRITEKLNVENQLSSPSFMQKCGTREELDDLLKNGVSKEFSLSTSDKSVHVDKRGNIDYSIVSGNEKYAGSVLSIPAQEVTWDKSNKELSAVIDPTKEYALTNTNTGKTQTISGKDTLSLMKKDKTYRKDGTLNFAPIENIREKVFKNSAFNKKENVQLDIPNYRFAKYDKTADPLQIEGHVLVQMETENGFEKVYVPKSQVKETGVEGKTKIALNPKAKYKTTSGRELSGRTLIKRQNEAVKKAAQEAMELARSNMQDLSNEIAR